MNLRNKVIRLAYTQPKLRPHLLPLLKEAQEKIALRMNTLKALMKKGNRFGVLSAYGPGSKKQNQIRHGELVADLQRMGYRWKDLKGSWDGVAEKSVLVPNMRFSDLISLGRKFGQISTIFKGKDGVIGMYYTDKGYAEVAVDPDTAKGEIQMAPGDELYSKGRGVSFEFDFLWGQKVPWDNRTPISRKEVKSLFESGDLQPA